ncbi:MAG: hypothetical protein IT463_11495 [Planctomycetes bacterium]|nr:hypothetical protein [Planctomycetota bacterium]
MNAPELLCPCCAAHLQPPPELHLMRCDNCHAELALLKSGGVSGLVQLPPVVSVPYSTPRQRAARQHTAVDADALVAARRAVCRESAARMATRWNAALRLMVVIGLMVGSFGYKAFVSLYKVEQSKDIENAALVIMGTFMALPVIVFVGLYFQGQARMAREEARKWSD